MELSNKGHAEYERILRWYAAQRTYRRVAWYVGGKQARPCAVGWRR